MQYLYSEKKASSSFDGPPCSKSFKYKFYDHLNGSLHEEFVRNLRERLTIDEPLIKKELKQVMAKEVKK